MRRISFSSFFLLLFLTGCASKNHAVRTQPKNHQTASLDQDQDLVNDNPILFEEEYEAQERGEVPTYDIPVDRNAKVEQWLAYFQGRGRKWFHIWLERSGRYIPVMRKILKEHDLPEDLVYLAMIESGFSARAYSRARAVGIWQFMKGTARLYGLRIDFWVDERRDPEKSSIAAARHLKDLYDQFQSWKLAAAAYNAGPAKVSRAIKKYKTEDFWELTKGRYLRPETRAYVPKMIAAALIAKEPHKYGFNDIQAQEPLSYDKLVLKQPINLVALSQKTETELEDLMIINPELNHPVTPPDAKDYELRVPSGKSEKFLAALSVMSDDEKFKVTAHRMRRGDTVAKLSKIYSIPAKEILNFNGLKTATGIREGRTLLVPVTLNEDLASVGQKAWRAEERVPRKRGRASRREAIDSVYQKSSADVTSEPIQISGVQKKKYISSGAVSPSGQ
jgi:membrane-bound lytic murein transglycosylase D